MSPKTNTLFGLLRDIIVGDPLRKQDECIEREIKRQAELTADSERDRVLSDFYTERKDNTDPHQSPEHAFAFAEAFRKQREYTESWASNKQKAEEAAARVSAAKARLTALQESGSGQ